MIEPCISARWSTHTKQSNLSDPKGFHSSAILVTINNNINNDNNDNNSNNYNDDNPIIDELNTDLYLFHCRRGLHYYDT